MAKKNLEQPRKTRNSVPRKNSTVDPEVGTRIAELIGRLGGLTRAAEVAAVSDETLAGWRDGRTKPSFLGIAAICRAAQVTTDWLLTGDGARQPDPREHAPAQISTLHTLNPEGFTFVPRLDIQASAGYGVVSVSEEPIETIAFRQEWLLKRGINPRHAAAVTAKGDSMDPIIRDGDLLLVDTSIGRVRDNGIYIVVVDGLIFVKRVHMHMDKSVTLISENKSYPPEKISAADLPGVTFAGRVMWFGRSI